MKFDTYFKNIKNIQFKSQILKICSYANLFSESCSFRIKLSLQPNFILKGILVPLTIYLALTDKKKKSKKIYLTKILKEMQLAVLIMRLLYKNFKIKKLMKGNCKILCICVCFYLFIFFCHQYMRFYFYQICIVATLETISRVTKCAQLSNFIFKHKIRNLKIILC